MCVAWRFLFGAGKRRINIADMYIGKTTLEEEVKMIDMKSIVQLYNSSEFSIIKEVNSSRSDSDKRYAFLLRFTDNKELVIKICKNAFTTADRITGWQKLCKKYLSIGIHCPQIVNSKNGRPYEITSINNEKYYMWAEEMSKYKTCDEFWGDDKPKIDLSIIQSAVLESIGKIAASFTDSDLLPFPSAFCVYDTFDSTDTVDENYANAENFCETAKAHFQEHSEYIDKIWSLFLHNRKIFEPVHRALPKASFQADINPSNILVDEDMNFAGYIDFNLSGTEPVLSYIITNDVCGYRLDESDFEQLMDAGFLKKCDDYPYKNLDHIRKHYEFSDYEKENICLCYNTIYPFSCWTANGMLSLAIKENKPQHIKPLLDWVYYQLSRDDIAL